MTEVELKIKDVFVEQGIMLENWRCRIIKTEGNPKSDFMQATVDVLKPHCRKPCITWVLHMNIVKEYIDFSKSYFIKPIDK